MIDSVLDSDVHSLTPFVSFLHPNVASDWAVSGAPLEGFLLCRRAADLDPAHSAREEFVAFLGFTPLQALLWHFAQTGRLGQLLGGTPPPISVELASAAICDHPLLLDGVRDKLSDQIVSEDVTVLIGLSAKLICLDRCMPSLIARRRTVIIVTESPVLKLPRTLFSRINSVSQNGKLRLIC
jgi:hypothetical protein